MSIASTQEIIAELKAGRMVILVDEEDRENEGDLMFAADFVSPEAINFMVRFARGLVCLTLTQEHCQRLNLPLMTQNNGTQYNTAFTVSIEAAQGVSTGISPADRARTIQAAVARDARAADIVQPGHIFPVTAQPGGVLVRAGHTEAGCDLTRLAGLTPAAVICEIINDDGTMARLPDLLEFAAKHSFKIGTIADLIEYRSLTESIIERVAERTMQTPYGPFHAVIYRDKSNGAPHIALVHGTPQPAGTTLVRVHEPMSVLDLLETDTAAHSWTLHSALQEIASSECGVIVLMNCSDSKEYLFNAFEAYNQPEKAAQLKHRPADFKTYGIGAQILRDLDVGKMHVLSSPRKLHAMSCYGLEVTGFVPMPGAAAQ
ncbi:bifunctional 3,4-dihydroxy-2-butanone-4-phosphate synthase/GTP cyclohydrolase II [Mycoavidus sp. HKI]|uniref:bifunctional 3,4-dihydroxy-2-butanone-4-phosphate synthase/GTP cyclohydrolase II n=1 Tax=Mycoavidus sp. HKI TaxID=2840467 RepID=UPI001CBBE5FE|nr:bifunctional 3,4-dihydroxy-2-butanone-4-phosphate synthase/GTP cyclohydrolase II [Mycoavidus sp. HKI]UAW64249.1 bifunctional 3,4-dihydroxy-2-butanone-4-phosphate synthase/GTP cyclohydrolase II [Mycoavidus sp. HKI]